MNKITHEEKAYYSLTKKVFNVLAPFYDFVCLPIYWVREKAVHFANAAKGSKILDIATGTGKQAFAFAKNGYDVIGVDITEAMLKVANKKNRYRNARFEIADVTKLPFENNSFDVSSVSFALHDMPTSIREKALKEMARVTKPKGTILIIDYALPKNRIGRFFIYNFIKLYEGEYYSKFINSDLEELIRSLDIDITEERTIIFGAGRFLKGINMKKEDK